MLNNRNLLHLSRIMAHRRRESQCLDNLVSLSGWSKFHLQRRFTRLLGESPKRFQQRLRLEAAAAALLATDGSVLDIALESGFGSHEVFARAFKRHFDCTPSAYRKNKLVGATQAQRTQHAEQVRRIGPCVGLYRMPLES